MRTVLPICPPLTTGYAAWLTGRRRTPYAFLIEDLYPETAIELESLNYLVEHGAEAWLESPFNGGTVLKS